MLMQRNGAFPLRADNHHFVAYLRFKAHARCKRAHIYFKHALIHANISHLRNAFTVE